MELYRRYSSFLAQLNNESLPNENKFKHSWKKNFAKLRQLILIGGPDDGVITPWQSAMFACYDSNECVVPMRKLEVRTDQINFFQGANVSISTDIYILSRCRY